MVYVITKDKRIERQKESVVTINGLKDTLLSKVYTYY